MKTTLVVLIFVLSSFCIAQNVITQTITVDAATLSDIRNTLDTSHYNCDEILINCSRSVVTVYEAEELLPDVFPAGYDVIKNSANKLQNILFPTSTDDPIAIFDGVVNNINATSSVQDIMNYFTGTGYSPIVEAAKRGLSLVYLCLNASYLYDCFYYKQYTAYGDPNTDVIMAVAKLRQVMCECIHLLEDSEVFYQGIREGTILGYKQFQHGVWAKDFRTYSYGSQLGEPPYPGLNLHQYRLNMYGASGLAALLIAETTDSSDPLHTEMISMISYIDSMLENVMIPEVFPVDYQKQGMLAFHTSNSGAYNESLAYAGFLLKNITPYFVARKRLSLGTKNHFDNPYIVSWVNDITKKIVPSPDGSSISKNWNYNDSCNQGGFYPSVLLFFYHASNIYSEEKNNVAWLVNCSRNGSGSYKYIEFGSTSLTSPFIMRYSSDPTCNPKISDIDYIPDFILNGAWSNSEFSILRKPATFQSGFLSSSSLNVLHENSWASAHAHADQTSFSYFYGGERYLLDSSGSNFSDNHSWRISPYAHNMVIINPNESLLNSSYYRPVSGIQDFNKAMLSANEIEPDPCTKEYFQSSPLLDILRVRLDYRNPAGDNLPRIAQLKRTFIRDDEIYIVFDDIEAQNPLENHDYWNLLHVDADLSHFQCSGNIFTVHKLNSVDIVCGSYQGNPIFSTDLCTTEGIDYVRVKQEVLDANNPKYLNVIVPRHNSAISDVLEQETSIDNSYCIAISRVTASIPFDPIITYVGCTNGETQSFNLSGKSISTDADMYLASIVTSEGSIVLDRSISLYKGDFLSINSTDIFRLYETGLNMITASYKDDALKVVLHDATLSHPRFKVYRNGCLSEKFIAIMRTNIEPVIPEPFPYSEDQSSRYHTTDIIQSLAYDDQYFYVNYSWEQLETEGIMNDGLIIVKGSIPETSLVASISLKGQINVEGDLTVPDTESLNILPVSQLAFANETGIKVFGTLAIEGGEARSVSLGSMNQQWAGILVHSAGSFTCSGAVIESAKTGVQIRGAVSITDCEIKNCQQAASIETATPFSIENSQIHYNDYGIVVSNNYTTSESGYLKNNEICQNGIGILLYNSNPLISLNDIHSNYQAGLYFVRGSDPIVQDCNISYTEQNGFTSHEIRLESESYPILDNGSNDINADGQGYSLYYASTGKINSMAARKNYWGCTNSLGIRQWIYPQAWDLTFEPFCMEANTSFLYVDDNLFLQALTAEKNGDLAAARQLYSTVVATEPDSLYALQSLGRLSSIYSNSPQLLNDLRSLFDAHTIACNDSDLVKTAQIKKIMLDRFAGLYLDALQGYEDNLNQSTTELDSLLCLLDIAYTLQDMYYDDQGKDGVTGTSYHANGLHVSSLKDAKQSVDQLWSQILNRPENPGLLEVPVPTKLEVTNYPNPFNPSTTIAFSIPEAGKVRVAIYNIKGQKVKDLINSDLPRGNHKLIWDGKDAANRNVGSGIYFLRLESGGKTSIRKAMLLK